jgi:Do/DeqQ family serine protease
MLVSVLSAGVAIGTYSYLNRKNENPFSINFPFSQQGFHSVGYATPAENTDFTYAAERSVNAVVHIKSIVRPSDRNRRGQAPNPFEFFFGERQPQPQVGFGSGVIISTDGYIVTNNHVIERAEEIEVTTNDQRTFTAKVIGRDESSDLALIKIEGNNFQALPFGDSDILKVGEWVLAVGNPFNLTSTVTAGIVSAKGRSDIFSSRGDTIPRIQSFIQTDAAVNRGNSGGALVNTKGELIGINTAIYSQTGNFVGYSFAVPVNIVQKIISDIKQFGIVQRAFMGILHIEIADLKGRDPDAYNKLKVTEGSYIVDFSANSASQKAGLQVGDVITAVNDIKIRNRQELITELSRYRPGDRVNVQIQRGDAVRTFTVELTNQQGTTELITPPQIKDVLGATFRELSREARERIGINYGIEITDISSGKLRSAGIRRGFVILTANDTRINTQEDFERVVENVLKRNPDERGLYIRGYNPNNRRTEYYAIDLND